MGTSDTTHITVVGAGYVGLANALLLSLENEVTLHDIDEGKIEAVRSKRSPITDPEIEDYLANKQLRLHATSDKMGIYDHADFVIIAAPTNYDPAQNYFDTAIVESVIEDVVRSAPQTTIIIKSTIPVGFTERMRAAHPDATILFSPEFLREGKALHDNLHPSRIVVGDKGEQGRRFGELLSSAAKDPDVPVFFMGSTEAEAVKLFANTYLAMRVSFFNELDTYAEHKGLDASEIISGVSSDPRIGDYYNNPSFGYGGYCLPKDSKQLRANYEGVPSTLIDAIVTSNETRIRHIADTVLQRNPGRVGIYRLAMKSGSDNFRESAIIHVISHLKDAGVEVVVYEPTLSPAALPNQLILSDLEEFLRSSDVILANRMSPELDTVRDKVYTRDIFARD